MVTPVTDPFFGVLLVQVPVVLVYLAKETPGKRSQRVKGVLEL